MSISEQTNEPKMRKYGSRYEVFDLGTAQMTRGGLSKTDLRYSRQGKIVSIKKSEAAKKSYSEFGFRKRTEPVVLEEKPKKKRRRKKKAKE